MGRKHTPESRAKISAAKTGIKQTPEHIEARIAPIRGRKQTPEHIAARTAAMKGRAPSPQTIEAAAAWHRGRKLSNAEREKVSEGLAAAKRAGRPVGRPVGVVARRRRRKEKVINSSGYVMVFPYPDADSRVPEHRWLMEQTLGRPLLPPENVHHKNGIRHDNRPENLELWVKTQPSGARVEDLIEWAEEILRRYK